MPEAGKPRQKWIPAFAGMTTTPKRQGIKETP